MKLCVAAVLLVMAWAAPAAAAAPITRRDPAGDVRGGAHLAESTRSALDIVRVTTRRDAAGLAVDVRLRGEFERLAGSGTLKGAVAEIVLRRTRGRRGVLLTRGADRRARVRSERVGAGSVVVRAGRVLRFRTAGDVSTVTRVDVRVAAGRASDRARVALPRSPSGGSPCAAYSGRRLELEGRLVHVRRALSRERTRSRRRRLTQERNRLEDSLFGLGATIHVGCPQLPPSGGTGETGNRAPVAGFTVSPPGRGYKAGQTLTFDATGSRDPDGRIEGFVWSDGSPPHAIGTGRRLSRWYGAPGVYTITLGVRDDRGGAAFASRTLFVGGQGTEALRNPDNSEVRIDCPGPGASPRSGVVEISVPSYAADQTAGTPNPCPDAALATTVSHVAGNAQGETDEWGRPRNTIRIAFQLDHVGPGAGNQNVALDWSASWR